MNDRIELCPDCGSACAEDMVGTFYCVVCTGRECDHVVAASNFSAAIKKHNAIPRWHSYGEPPSDYRFKYVVSAVGPLLARYTPAGWTDANGYKLQILKWTDTPMDLPVCH